MIWDCPFSWSSAVYYLWSLLGTFTCLMVGQLPPRAIGVYVCHSPSAEPRHVLMDITEEKWMEVHMASWGPGLGLPCHYFGHINWHHTIGVYFMLTSSPLVVGLTGGHLQHVTSKVACSVHERWQRNRRGFLWAKLEGNTACSAHVPLAESHLWVAERWSWFDGQLPVSAPPS